MTRRISIAGILAAGIAAALLVGGVLNEPLDAEAGPTVSPAVRGLAYQQRWRETADPSYLTRSEAVLRQGDPSDPLVVSALASLALSRHDFGEALRLARRARALAPRSARSYGVLGDALVELGRYDEAFRAFETMADLKPGLAAYARIAYARELLGRPRAAVAAMELALGAAGGQPEPTAWTHVELGKLHFGLGDLAPAERHFRAALAALPGYVFALDGLARVEGARGRFTRAIALARRAADSVPLPQVVATLTDLYRASGRERDARREQALMGVIERLFEANGVRTDLETAVFDLDQGIRLRDALLRARRAYAERPGIEAADALAWALVRNGRCREALVYSRSALALGTRDAVKLFHRGMAERCLGRPAEARRWFRRALAVNPYFSLRFAPLAERYAR